MDLRIVCKMLGIVAMLIGVTMIFSLPWAFPAIGVRTFEAAPNVEFELMGFLALLGSIVVSFAVSGLFWIFGRKAEGELFRKEAMAVVGLSWVLATILGALPFWLSGTFRDLATPMTFVDALFESQSGFSTTGATVIANIENTAPMTVPHCILFWRSSTHFLGGLGIIVLFVAILGQGSAGKALMRSEMPGPSKDGPQSRMQHTAWVFAAIYGGLNVIQTIALKAAGMTWFDALCHAFGTMATGGFSTYDKSVGQFDSGLVDSIIVLFMVLAGTNFTLLYLLCLRKPAALFADVEWRTYIGVILLVTGLVVVYGLANKEFDNLLSAIRYGLFQVVAIVTTTGYGTHDFDNWNNFGRAALFLLMFVGGCAGSTGGGMKVIRHILFVKILWLEIERAFHPTVVRPLRLGGRPIDDPELRQRILVYFGLIVLIFVISWIFLVATEPDATWGGDAPGNTLNNKLIDSASAIAATLNNIGPGFGILGATKNYCNFSPLAKLLFTWLMMLGRLELFVMLVLIVPRFWRAR